MTFSQKSLKKLSVIGWLCLISCWSYAQAGTPVCTTGAEQSVYSLLGQIRDYPRGADWQQNMPSLSSKSLRVVFAILQCPQEAERALTNEDNRDTASRWIAALPDALAQYVPQPLTPGIVGQMIEQLRCDAKLPTLCKVRNQLLILPHAQRMKRQRGIGSLCNRLGHTLMDQGAADFRHSDGAAVVAALHDLAFLLASCPTEFYRYMHEHPADIDHWLQKSQMSLFWGEPEVRAALEAYRSELIALVQRSLRCRRYRKEKKKVLSGLETAKVRVIE